METPIWTTGRASGEPLVLSGAIRIDEEKIMYQPGIAEVLKFGWVQYATLFLLVLVILYPTYKFIVRTGVVATWAVSDRNPSSFKTHIY